MREHDDQNSESAESIELWDAAFVAHERSDGPGVELRRIY